MSDLEPEHRFVIAGSLVPGKSRGWAVSAAMQDGDHVGVAVVFRDINFTLTLTDNEALTLAAKLANATDCPE